MSPADKTPDRGALQQDWRLTSHEQILNGLSVTDRLGFAV
jgi:hypothetical protein